MCSSIQAKSKPGKYACTVEARLHVLSNPSDHYLIPTNLEAVNAQIEVAKRIEETFLQSIIAEKRNQTL